MADELLQLPLELPTLTKKEEKLRERDLFKYYRPSTLANHVNQSPLPATPFGTGPCVSPDAHLTALAQLVALRMNTKRCVISVVHNDTSYVISESTRTLVLTDTRRSDVEGDNLFFGCSTVARSDSLCSCPSPLLQCSVSRDTASSFESKLILAGLRCPGSNLFLPSISALGSC